MLHCFIDGLGVIHVTWSTETSLGPSTCQMQGQPKFDLSLVLTLGLKFTLLKICIIMAYYCGIFEFG